MKQQALQGRNKKEVGDPPALRWGFAMAVHNFKDLFVRKPRRDRMTKPTYVGLLWLHAHCWWCMTTINKIAKQLTHPFGKVSQHIGITALEGAC